jgi:hypothetical protein
MYNVYAMFHIPRKKLQLFQKVETIPVVRNSGTRFCHKLKRVSFQGQSYVFFLSDFLFVCKVRLRRQEPVLKRYLFAQSAPPFPSCLTLLSAFRSC